MQFQPTPSARRVTYLAEYAEKTDSISTHTLRKEGDLPQQQVTRVSGQFQPTPSARRVTDRGTAGANQSAISTHTLRKEGDGVAFEHITPEA